MMAETYVLQALQNGLATIRSSPDLLGDILDALNENELAAAKQWFGDTRNRINIAPGFPSEPSHLPFVGVTIGEDNQMPEQTGIGLSYYTIDTSIGPVEARGARFRGTIKATIYTNDANLIIWLSAVAQWALLSQYDWFGDVAGFNNLQLNVGDYEPSPEFLPGFVFARGVFLNAEHDKVFTQTQQTITSVQLNGNYSVYEGE